MSLIRVVLLCGWIFLAMAYGMDLRNDETLTIADYNLQNIEITSTQGYIEDASKKPQDALVLKRSKRTLILIRELTEKGAQIGDTCNVEEWEKRVNQIYKVSQGEGTFNNVLGLAMANETKIWIINQTMTYESPAKSPSKMDGEVKTFAKMLCVGRYPLKCDRETSRCQCLDLYPMYNLTQDIADERFCNVRLGDYCNENLDLYCAHSYPCIKHKCQKGARLNFNKAQPALASNHKVMTIIVLIAWTINFL